MSHPVTDIICLVNNNVKLTKGFVDHLFANTKNFNLIFFDNGSEDEVKQFLQNGNDNKKWKLIRSEKNIGIIKGRNESVKYVKSDFFLNIDNDQYVGPGWLENLFSIINNGYDVCGCESWQMLSPGTGGVIHMNNQTINDRSYFPFRRNTKKGSIFTYIGCGGCLIKRKIYDKIGLFDTRFSPYAFEDPDWCFRCIKENFSLGWSYNCPIMHLTNQTVNNQNLFNKHKQFLYSWEKFKKKWYPYFPSPMQMNK